MISRKVRLILAAACLCSIVSARDIGASSSSSLQKAGFINSFVASQRSDRSRRQALSYDEFGLPRFSSSPSRGSTVFDIGRRSSGIPGSFLGGTNIFGNESPLLGTDALQATEQPRYGPNHPPAGPYVVPPRYSSPTLSSNHLDLSNEPLPSLTDQTVSSIVSSSPNSLSFTDQVTTDSPASLPDFSTLSSADANVVDGQEPLPDTTVDPFFFIPTKPSVPFPLTIDPGTPSPVGTTVQPTSQTPPLSITAAPPVASGVGSSQCYCPCLTPSAPVTYAPAEEKYVPPPPVTAAPPVIPPVPYAPPSTGIVAPPPVSTGYGQAPPLALRQLPLLGGLVPLQQQPKDPFLVFGPAPPRGVQSSPVIPFPLPTRGPIGHPEPPSPDGQVGHPEPPSPPSFPGDTNALDQQQQQLQQQQQFGLGRFGVGQFGVGQLSGVGHPEPPPPPTLFRQASHLKSNGAFLRATVITLYLPLLLILRQL